MNLDRKAAVPKSNSPVVGGYPSEFPKLPDDVKERFPALEQWERDVVKWYEELQTVLNRQRQGQ